MNQLRRGVGGPGIGFASNEKGVNLFGKIGEYSGLKPSEKAIPTPKLTKNTPPKPIEPIVKDGIVEEPPKAPPQKQVWIPKPNHLRNPLDTLPDIPEDPLPKAKQPTKVNHTHQKENQPPKREVRYHCEYCKRDVHLVEFCFRRKRDERREYELNNRDMITLLMVYMYLLFRGTLLDREVQCLKVLGLRLRDHVVVMPDGVQVVANTTLVSVMAFSVIALADHVFRLVVIAFLKWDLACLVFFLTLFQGI